jgi:hypothetical protein
MVSLGWGAEARVEWAACGLGGDSADLWLGWMHRVLLQLVLGRSHVPKECYAGVPRPDGFAGDDRVDACEPEPVRAWCVHMHRMTHCRPESGLSKFEDIMAAVGARVKAADYFYFMDADVRFQAKVELTDIAGDLVGVEHPMYPR